MPCNYCRCCASVGGLDEMVHRLRRRRCPCRRHHRCRRRRFLCRREVDAVVAAAVIDAATATVAVVAAAVGGVDVLIAAAVVAASAAVAVVTAAAALTAGRTVRVVLRLQWAVARQKPSLSCAAKPLMVTIVNIVTVGYFAT